MIISERIFKILKEKGISQNAFAKAVGLSGSTVSDWKTKKTNPSSDKIMTICSVLEVTPEQLLTGKGIDEDYDEKNTLKMKADFVITNSDKRIIQEYHSLSDEHKFRMLKYMEALKKVEELEYDVNVKTQL